jgi:hypothetical protein
VYANLWNEKSLHELNYAFSVGVFLNLFFINSVFFPAAANKAALAVAMAADLQFIRAEGFVFSHVADEGLHEPQIHISSRRVAQSSTIFL